MKSRSFHIQTLDQRQRLQQFIGAREIPFQAEIGPIREQRTLPQNRRLWSLHQLAADVTGYTPEEMHELMLKEFFGTKLVQVGGVQMEVPLKRSSTREKDEFRAFLDSVEHFYASQLGVWFRDE